MWQRDLGRPALVALLLAGCGGAPVPTKQLNNVQASIRGAEVAGVNRSPSAAPYLALARDNLTRAEREIRDGDNEEAALTLERAEADADLAQAISSEEKERLLSLQAKKRTQELRTQMQP